ncbi:cytotoxin-like [Ornithodoros turicata]|uniref:cytotoxin-like n=1 Tax=Ornithodoros turicata TaxID=34597 RepID=UPI003138C408
MLCTSVALCCNVILFFQAFTTAARHSDGELPNIEALIDDFVKAAAGKNTVVWWDMSAEHDVLKNTPRFRNRKVTVTEGPIVYGNATNVSMREPEVYEHWVHNGRYNESHTSSVKKITTHTHTYTWTLDRTFTLDGTYKLSVGPSEGIGIESTTRAFLSLRRGSGDTRTDVTQVEVHDTVTVKPRSSMKLIWTVNKVAKDMPWAVNITLCGWVAVWYYKSVSGHHLWFYPIDFLAWEGLQHVPGGGIQFTASGTFTAVNSQMSSLRLEEHDLYTYSSKPLNVTYLPVKETPIAAVKNNRPKVHPNSTTVSYSRTLGGTWK